MAFENESGNFGTTMLVGPTGYANGGGNGFFGGDWAWILLLLLIGGNGWGFGGGFGGGYGAMMGMDYGLYPWLNNSQHISDGFRDQMLNSSINSIGDKITSGFGDVATQLCGGFAGVNASINGAQNALATQMYTNQIADMERSFAAQTASTQGMTAIQSQLAQCCCDNKSAALENRYVLAQEACATRTADANNTTAILNALNGGIQSIKDQLCTDKIEQKNDLIAQLRSELMYARGQASQDVQTAAIQAGQRALANEVEQYVLPTPRPAYIVQNPNCCVQSFGCGCAA